MTSADVPAVVDVHLRSFQGFFLSSLGGGFLRQLYASILEDATGIAFVAEDAGTVTGFVAGTLEPSGFYKRLIKQRLIRFAAASVMPLLRRPTILPRLLRALTMPQKNSDNPAGTALLMSFAVAPDRQRGGVGRRLNDAFLQNAWSRGALRVILTTDRMANDPVNAFYVRQGFRVVRTFTTPEGREMNEYEITKPGA